MVKDSERGRKGKDDDKHLRMHKRTQSVSDGLVVNGSPPVAYALGSSQYLIALRSALVVSLGCCP